MTSLDNAVALARKYLFEATPAERGGLAADMDRYSGDLDRVVEALRSRPRPDGETGWMLSRGFRSPRLAGQYPEQPLTIYVPPDYDPSKKCGLIIFLHGGGQGSGDGGRHAHDLYNVNDLFEEDGRIFCYPSAPPHERSWARWNLPGADDYLADVIEEIDHHWPLDPDNISLGGTSMGGIGALHMAHRLADRFATVFSASSHWDFACWPSLRGTALWLLQGLNDAVLFRRRHGTDIAFARCAKLRLEQAGIEHIYREHAGGHALCDARWALRDWLAWSGDRRRDPFYPHVVAVTPRGLTPWSDWRRHKTPLAAHENSTDFHSLAPAPHARWVTIDGVGPETIVFDMMTMSDCRDEVEEDWNNITLTLKCKHIPGGLVEAVIRDDKVIEVAPRNVTGFTLWLHPKMVDLNDVRIIVSGKERFRGPVQPRLATLLDSYLRRRDWGMLYPARVTIDDDGTWTTRDQLGVKP